VSIFQPFYDAIAWLVVHIHEFLSPIFGANSGASWALSIVLLTILMRILLIPLFVKQIKSQRAMTALQPQIKALQAKYKNDKNKLNEEMMKLWRENGVNPFMGCLPLLPQIPIFFALFHTLNNLRPVPSGSTYIYPTVKGFTHAQVVSAANAKIFGVPIAAAFNSPESLLKFLDASPTSTKILCAVLTLLMVATTFLTQRQMLARNAAQNANNPMAGQQKIILYILPLLFLVYGYRFPVGVLLYWLTTNVWSMGQQFIVLRRMDAQAAAAVESAPPAPEGPAPGAKPARPKSTPPSTAPGGAARPLPAAGDAARGGGPAPGQRPGGAQGSTARRARKRKR